MSHQFIKDLEGVEGKEGVEGIDLSYPSSSRGGSSVFTKRVRMSKLHSGLIRETEF